MEGSPPRVHFTSYDEVPSSMYPERIREEPVVPLQQGRKPLNGLLFEDERRRVSERIVHGCDVFVQIPLQTPWEVFEGVRHIEGFLCAVLREGGGADVHPHVHKGAGLDAAAARAGLEEDEVVGEGLTELEAVVGYEFTIASHRSIRPVEDW